MGLEAEARAREGSCGGFAPDKPRCSRVSQECVDASNYSARIKRLSTTSGKTNAPPFTGSAWIEPSSLSALLPDSNRTGISQC